MVVSFSYPACSAACNDIVMEFKVFACVLCCPDTAIVSPIHQAISHRVTMARAAFCIQKNNRVLTVVKNAMVKDESVAIGDRGHTHREQVNIPCEQALCYQQIFQVLAV